MTDNPSAPRKATWRIGARQRERLQWALVAIICAILVFALMPYYNHIIVIRDYQTCQSNMLKIAHGLSLYSADYDDGLPIGDSWMTAVKGYMAAHSGTGFSVESIFKCPEDKSQSDSSYAFNSVLGGYSPTRKSDPGTLDPALSNLGRPDRVPLIFELHGSRQNAHARITDWDALAKQLTLPHALSQPTGSIITGGLKPSAVDKEKLDTRAGHRF